VDTLKIRGIRTKNLEVWHEYEDKSFGFIIGDSKKRWLGLFLKRGIK
jgi:hypothetical protein